MKPGLKILPFAVGVVLVLVLVAFLTRGDGAVKEDSIVWADVSGKERTNAMMEEWKTVYPALQRLVFAEELSPLFNQEGTTIRVINTKLDRQDPEFLKSRAERVGELIRSKTKLVGNDLYVVYASRAENTSGFSNLQEQHRFRVEP